MTRRFSMNKATAILAVFLVLCLMIGSLAFFTDRISTTANMSTVDNALDIIPEKDPTVDPDDPTNPNKPGGNVDPDDYEDPTPNDPDDDLTNWWAYLNSKAMKNFNPGDKMTLNFKMSNKGNLGVDMRETFVITSNVDMTANDPEFCLFTDVSQNADTKEWTGTQVAGTMTKISNKEYKFVIAESNIAAGASADKDYYVVFAGESGNKFQGATCTVDYLAEAMQEDGNWATAATATLTLGGSNTVYDVVPAALPANN